VEAARPTRPPVLIQTNLFESPPRPATPSESTSRPSRRSVPTSAATPHARPAPSSIPSVSWAGLEELRADVHTALSRHVSRGIELEDVVQESLMRAARYRASLGDSSRLRGWVIRIALNVLRDHVRRDLRLPRIEQPDEVFEATEGREAIPGDDPDEEPVEAEGIVFEREFLLRHLDRALAELPRTDRRVLSAWYADDDDRRRASHVRETAPELAKVRAFRARSRLTRLLRLRLSLDAPDVALELAGDEARRRARCTPGQEKKKERGGRRRARS